MAKKRVGKFPKAFRQMAVDRLNQCDNIKATIWENTSEKGPFFSATFSRPFKGQSGEWRNGTSFGLNDLEALLTVAREAKEWIVAHAMKR